MKKIKIPKDVWRAIIILAILIILSLANTIFFEKTIGELTKDAESLNFDETDASKTKVKAICEKFESLSFFFSITVNHDNIGDAKLELYELCTAVNEEDKTAAEIAKSRFIQALKQLKRLMGAGIDSVI